MAAEFIGAEDRFAVRDPSFTTRVQLFRVSFFFSFFPPYLPPFLFFPFLPFMPTGILNRYRGYRDDFSTIILLMKFLRGFEGNESINNSFRSTILVNNLNN